MSGGSSRVSMIGLVAGMLCFALTLTFVAPEADAKRQPRQRVETQEYVALGGGGVAGADVCAQAVGEQATCFGWEIHPRERVVSLEVVDDTGLPVPGYLRVVYGGGQGAVGALDWEKVDYAFCGSVKDIDLEDAVEVGVILNDFSPTDPCPGLATTGEATATFSR